MIGPAPLVAVGTPHQWVAETGAELSAGLLLLALVAGIPA